MTKPPELALNQVIRGTGVALKQYEMECHGDNEFAYRYSTIQWLEEALNRLKRL